MAGGAGADTLNGGTGTDTVDYSLEIGIRGVNVDLSDLLDQRGVDTFGTLDTLKSIENIVGSNRNDVLTGSNIKNSIFGLNGNDTIGGLQGQDRLDGGNGNDTISTAAGLVKLPKRAQIVS